MLYDVVLYVFFFKQKTAYEMRISDWSSDVCSSDLNLGAPVFFIERPPGKSSSSRHRAANVNPDTPVHRAPGLPLRAFIRKWNAVGAACARAWLLPTARLGATASLRRHGG